MADHALLSASGASRWLVCTPSARLEEFFDESESEYADEGTTAHKLAEIELKHRLYIIDSEEYDSNIFEIQNNPHYNESMQDYVEEYVEFVMEKKSDTNLILLEQRLELSEFIPKGFGTTDVMLINPSMLEVIDFKYGKGVPVNAFENSQMMVYALGAFKEFEFMYNKIKHIRMTIYQPRIENISVYEMTAEELLHWGYTVLKPTAKLAFEGFGPYVAGDHCRFCRARAACKENAKYNLQVAAREFALPLITDEQITKILLRAQAIRNWLTAVEDYALKKAIEGKKWPGLKLVKGRSVRKYQDEKAILENLIAEGFKEDEIVNKKLPGITLLSKKFSKLVLQKCVEPHIIKPDGKPTLTVEADKRPEFNSLEDAQLDFSDEL